MLNKYKIRVRPYTQYESFFMYVWDESEDQAIRACIILAENTRDYKSHYDDDFEVNLIESEEQDLDQFGMVTYVGDYKVPIDYL